MFRTLILGLLMLSMTSVTTMHKYYFSLTQVEHVQKSNALQITMNVFVDDIENALNKVNNRSFFLNTEQETKDIDKYFVKYLKERFKVNLNNKNTEYNYLGHQYEGDVVYFYIEIENITSISSIEIQNKVLIDAIPEQQNLIKLKINNKFKSLMLNKENDKGMLKF